MNELNFCRPHSCAYSQVMDIGTRLDKAMKAAGFRSQTALAKASGVPQPTINRILKNTGKKGPETETLKKLAGACRVSFEYLNEGIDSGKVAPAPAEPYELLAHVLDELIIVGESRKAIIDLVREKHKESLEYQTAIQERLHIGKPVGSEKTNHIKKAPHSSPREQGEKA